jgi:hypothetical protein
VLTALSRRLDAPRSRAAETPSSGEPLGHEPVSAEPAAAPSADPEPAAAEPVSAQTVRALYLALLNREPDPEGLGFWTRSTSVEDVVGALAATEEYRERVHLLAAAGASGVEPDLSAGEVAVRLENGDGLVSLTDGALVLEGLSTMPWAEVEEDPVWVLGPYGQELAGELVTRGLAGHSTAGLRMAGADDTAVSGEQRRHRTATLILTEERYVAALARLRPDVLGGTLRTIMHPVSVAAGTPADDTERVILVARQRLHRLGFIEVSQVFGRRYGGGTVVVDRTYTTPELGRLYERSAGEHGVRPPRSVWLVGRRTPVLDRA